MEKYKKDRTKGKRIQKGVPIKNNKKMEESTVWVMGYFVMFLKADLYFVEKK